MKFSELTKCPFCGSEEYYTTSYCFGRVDYYQRFDGGETDNGGMYAGLSERERKTERAYCGHCEKYLGDIEADTVGKEAVKALAKGANR